MSEAEIQRMNDALDELIAEKASKKLRYFFAWSWNFHQGTPLTSNWHIDCIAEHIEAALNREIRRLAITVSPRSCLKQGTEIRMFDGSSKAIEKIQPDDLVLSLDIQSGKHCAGKVSANLNNGKQEIYKITLQNGDFVYATDTHRFYTWNGYRYVKDLVVGDDISVAKGYNSVIPKPETLVSDEELRCLALWMAEGNKGDSSYRVTNSDKEISRQLAIDAELLGYKYNILSNAGKLKQQSMTGFSARLNQYAGYWVKSCLDESNVTTYNLRIPRFIYSLPIDKITTYLGMWIATDGWISKSSDRRGSARHIGITLASKQCVEDLAELFNSIGITCQQYTLKVKLKDKVFDAWKLIISGKTNLQLCQQYFKGKCFSKNNLLSQLKTGGEGSDKAEVPWQWVLGASVKDKSHYNRIVKQKRWSNVHNIPKNATLTATQATLDKINAEEYWQKIESIEYAGEDTVYDISVDKYDNFTLANGIHSHNSKSTLASVSAPAFRWISHPEERFFLASHKLDLCTTNLLGTRNIINHPSYKSRYCDPSSPNFSFKLSEDQSTKKKIGNTGKGEINISSPDTGIIGSGGTVFLIDDIIDEQMYKNETIRRERNVWVTDQLFGRSNDVNTDVKMAICQRLGDDDLINHLFQKYKGEDSFFELCIPAEFAKRKTYFSPLGEKWNDPRKEEGELMDEKRLPLSYLNTIDPVRRKTLFQQDPSGGGKGITIDDNDIRFTTRIPSSFDSMLIMWDLTFAASEASKSWNVGGVFGRKGDDYFVIDGIRDKLSIMGQVAAVKKLSKKYPYAEMGIEAKANGEAVSGFLKQDYPDIILFKTSLWGGTSQADKEKRFGAVVPIIKEGHLYFYRPERTDYKLEDTYDPNHARDEIVGFPLYSTNDWVDIVSYALGYLSQKINNNTIMIFGEETPIMTEEEYWQNHSVAKKTLSGYNENTDIFIFTDTVPNCEDISQIQF